MRYGKKRYKARGYPEVSEYSIPKVGVAVVEEPREQLAPVADNVDEVGDNVTEEAVTVHHDPKPETTEPALPLPTPEPVVEVMDEPVFAEAPEEQKPTFNIEEPVAEKPMPKKKGKSKAKNMAEEEDKPVSLMDDDAQKEVAKSMSLGSMFADNLDSAEMDLDNSTSMVEDASSKKVATPTEDQ